MKVRQIIQRKGSAEVATIGPDATLSQAAQRLTELKIGCLLVTDSQDRMVGILSERDIVKTIGREGAACLDHDVESVMTVDVVTCDVDSAADEVLLRMTEGRFRHMPVTERDARAGMISIGDVVKARIETLEQDNEHLETMIRSATG